MAVFTAFYNTRKMFIECLNYTKPLSFEEWKASPDDLKAAILFVQFFNEITAAWSKADTLNWGDDAEGVTTVLQYLEKQVRQKLYFMKNNTSKKASAEFRRKNPDGYIEVEVRKIEENPERFSQAYMYKVAYNCLYCIAGHDRKCDKDRIDNEVSAIVEYEGKELNLFDEIHSKNGSAEDQYNVNVFETQFWSVIEDSGLSAEKVMRYLLSQDPAALRKLSRRNKYYSVDPLRDVEVPLEAVESVLKDLREKFLSVPASSPCGQLISRFNSALA